MRSNRDLGNQGARRWRQCQTRQKAQAGSGVQLPVKLGATPVTMVEFTSSHCHQSVSAARRKYHPRSPFDAIGPIASGTPHRGDPCSCLGRSALHLKGDEGSFVDAFKRQVLSVTRVLYPVEYAAVGTPAPDESCLWPRRHAINRSARHTAFQQILQTTRPHSTRQRPHRWCRTESSTRLPGRHNIVMWKRGSWRRHLLP
jgi:hypothetical protein